MLLVGWIGCPQCEFRRRVCVAVEWISDAPGTLTVQCPMDCSTHRISMIHFGLVEQCPPDLTVSQPTDFAPADGSCQFVQIHQGPAEPPADQPRRPWWKFWWRRRDAAD